MTSAATVASAAAATTAAAGTAAMRSASDAAAMTATETAAVRSGGIAAAMHTAKTRLAAGGKMVCQTAMVESTECAGALTRRRVRRDKPAIGSVIDRSASIARDVTRETMRLSASKA